MNPIVLQLANGNLFFVGLVMIVAALFLRLWFEGRIPGLVLRIGYIAGIVFVIFSATPLSNWFYCLWFGLCVAATLAVFSNKFSFQKKIMVMKRAAQSVQPARPTYNHISLKIVNA